MSLLGTKKTPQTKLGNACRRLAEECRSIGRDVEAHQLDRAAANLDQAAISLAATGARVKTLGSYYNAAQLFRQVAGKPYEG